MRFRKLRIVCSVFWGLACILLIMLWVRTVFVCDQLGLIVPNNGLFTITSRQGGIGVAKLPLFRPLNLSYRLFTVPANTLPTFKYDLQGFGFGFGQASSALKPRFDVH